MENKEPGESPVAAHVVALLNYYFELGNATAKALLEEWLERYPAPWIRLAIIESLYQGRYRAISVSQILEVWHRRQQVLQHFSYDFECLVGNNLPGNSPEIPETAPESETPADATTAETPVAEEEEATRPSIGQFTPNPDRSDFYTRLQAIVGRAREKRERETAAEASEGSPTEEVAPTDEGKTSSHE
ncbi:MAG: hypothetical protein WBB29_09045 [Geitlerinemataceae cyanobacterium]